MNTRTVTHNGQTYMVESDFFEYSNTGKRKTPETAPYTFLAAGEGCIEFLGVVDPSGVRRLYRLFANGRSEVV